jgi:hypothetical protein
MISKYKARITLGLSIALLLAMILPCACTSNSLVGIYMTEDETSGSYLNLLDDGTYEMAMGFTGRWERHGDRIIITTVLGADYLQIEGTNLRFSDGTLLIKQ